MKSVLRRITGILLVVTAFLGLLFSTLAIVQLWRLEPGFEQSLALRLDRLDSTVTTTKDGLAIVDNSLETASSNIDSLEEASGTLAQSLKDSAPMVDSLIALVGTDLPATITATQTSLESARTSAVLIDNMLATVSQIPLLGLSRYQPEVPLNVALDQVAASMDNLPSSLKTIEDSLNTTQASLTVMDQQVTKIGKDFQQINENLAAARGVIDEYQSTMLELQGSVDRAQAGLHLWLTRLTWLLTFVLVWLGIMQIGLLTQGLGLLGYNNQVK